MVLSQKEDVQTPFFYQISIGKPTRTIATIDQLRISQERGLQLSMVYFWLQTDLFKSESHVFNHSSILMSALNLNLRQQ